MIVIQNACLIPATISGSLNIFTADSAASLDLEINSSLIEPILRFAISQPFYDAQPVNIVQSNIKFKTT